MLFVYFANGGQEERKKIVNVKYKT